MKHEKIAVLIIDDSENDALLLRRLLSRYFLNIHTQRVDHAQALQHELQHATWDIILCDIRMPNFDVPSVLNMLQKDAIQIPLIVVSGHVKMEDALNLIQHGATDFVRKDDDVRLIPSIERALADFQVKQEKKEAMQALRQAKEEAELANKAKSDFLMVMNHELRTPLHGIIGMLDLLAEDNQGWSSDQRDDLQTARESSKSLRYLINDILDLTAAETGSLHLQHHQYDLPACLEGALAPFLLAVNDKGLAFEMVLKQIPRLVRGDEARLRQVVLNLVGNAMKFTDEGSISLLAEVRTTGAGCEKFYFSVEDTGYGIPADRLDEVFLPFTQFATAGKHQQAGTGLGTSIVQQFVAMMGGQVWVTSTLGEGSCFSFEIPLEIVQSEHNNNDENQSKNQGEGQAKSQGIEYVNHAFKTGDHTIQAPPPQATPAPKSTTNATRVLLAEDDPVSQKIAVKRLKRAGLSVDVASDGEQAWRLVHQQHDAYDILLTDLRMPSMDGISLTKKVRHFEMSQQLNPLTIIGLSAHALQNVKNECMAAGMNQFLSKPIDAEHVLQAIEAANTT